MSSRDADIGRMAAELGGACSSARDILAAALAKVPAAERAAVLARIERPIHLLLDVFEQLALKPSPPPASRLAHTKEPAR